MATIDQRTTEERAVKLLAARRVLDTEIPLATPGLVGMLKDLDSPYAEIDWPVGLTLHVTPLQARVLVSDPDILPLVEESGYSFTVIA